MVNKRTFDEIINDWRERRENVRLAWELGIFGIQNAPQSQRTEVYKAIIEQISNEEEAELLEVIHKGHQLK